MEGIIEAPFLANERLDLELQIIYQTNGFFSNRIGQLPEALRILTFHFCFDIFRAIRGDALFREKVWTQQTT